MSTRPRMQGALADTSLLLRLAREIRDLIWECLLSSTTLSSGEHYTSRITTYPVKPHPHSLAILRTCRQIHHETKDIWLKLVLFDFTHIEYLLDKFSPLPLPILSQIHRARVSSRPLMLSPPGDDDDVYYRIGHALALVPGLQLKKLEVDASNESNMVIYDTISSLIERSNGWRELRVFIPHSRVLAYKSDMSVFDYPQYRRSPQPDSWARALRKRDRQNSRSEVKIYRTRKMSAAPGAVHDPSMRETFKQDGPKTQADITFGLEEDAFLIGEQEAGKEMLIVAKRAPDADIVEDIKRQDASKYDGYDIRQWAGNMTWDEVKKVSKWLPGDNDSCEEDNFQDEEVFL